MLRAETKPETKATAKAESTRNGKRNVEDKSRRRSKVGLGTDKEGFQGDGAMNAAEDAVINAAVTAAVETCDNVYTARLRVRGCKMALKSFAKYATEHLKYFAVRDAKNAEDQKCAQASADAIELILEELFAGLSQDFATDADGSRAKSTRASKVADANTSARGNWGAYTSKGASAN